jgi:putative ABC transport system substrate-binding protein
MRRREFITLLGATSAFPFSVGAQQPTMPVIGYLELQSPQGWGIYLSTFLQGLKEVGFVEGKSVAIEYRWADGQNDRLPALAADLVRQQVAVIAVPGGSLAALAAKAATATIPIVFQIGNDPVKLGLVASMNRPGGNVTGISNMAVGLAAKRLGLLHELVPNAAAVAVLFSPTSPNYEITRTELEDGARSIGLNLIFLNVSSEREFDAAFATLVQRKADALLVTDNTLFNNWREELVALAARHTVPTIYTFPEFATAGGLISYAPSLREAYRQAGIYTGRILKGTKPADLPVLQPTKFELVINLKTAKALGLTVPPTLLARADEVIE